MLKSTVESPGQPNKVLMALGGLQGYLKNPLGFFVATLLTIPRFKKQIPADFPAEFVRANALQAWLYIRLKSQVGQEQAYEVVRAIVVPIGLTLQQGNFRSVEAPRSFENLITYQQRTMREGITRWNTLEILEQSAYRYEIRVTNCMYYNFYNQLGIPEMTRMMCAVDNAIFNTYLPEEITFHRNGIGNRIADGAAACQFVMEYHARSGDS
ncbi:MAG: L-2-amino-thiazoline-4-carboxylic acid hydrolase [Anaerolineae bacterium]|nr:L-2-amino-thiazoline-4-carboxylic acid hydrolase [Anaerolineae bacterium]